MSGGSEGKASEAHPFQRVRCDGKEGKERLVQGGPFWDGRDLVGFKCPWAGSCRKRLKIWEKWSLMGWNEDRADGVTRQRRGAGEVTDLRKHKSRWLCHCLCLSRATVAHEPRRRLVVGLIQGWSFQVDKTKMTMNLRRRRGGHWRGTVRKMASGVQAGEGRDGRGGGGQSLPSGGLGRGGGVGGQAEPDRSLWARECVAQVGKMVSEHPGALVLSRA